MRIVRHRGAAQALQAYLDRVAGHADAQEGWMLDMHAGPKAGRYRSRAAKPGRAQWL